MGAEILTTQVEVLEIHSVRAWVEWEALVVWAACLVVCTLLSMVNKAAAAEWAALTLTISSRCSWEVAKEEDSTVLWVKVEALAALAALVAVQTDAVELILKASNSDHNYINVLNFNEIITPK